MMRMDAVSPGDGPVITSYGDGGFTISGQPWRGSVMVGPKEVTPWAVTDPAVLDAAGLAAVFVHKPEILLVGCGTVMVPLPPLLRVALAEAGIKAEAMTTAGACHSYSILSADGRSVMAALIAVD